MSAPTSHNSLSAFLGGGPEAMATENTNNAAAIALMLLQTRDIAHEHQPRMSTKEIHLCSIEPFVWVNCERITPSWLALTPPLCPSVGDRRQQLYVPHRLDFSPAHVSIELGAHLKVLGLLHQD